MGRRSKRTQELSPKQLAVIAELIRGATITRAAEAVGVSRRQVTRWQEKLAFKHELERQKSDKYEADLLKAHEILVGHMDEDEPDEVRYRAANALLQYDIKLRRRQRGKHTSSNLLDQIQQVAGDWQRALDQQRALDRQDANTGEEPLNAEFSEVGEPDRLKQLSPEQLAVIVELARGATVVDAARITGVPRRTITRWLAEDSDFKQEVELQKSLVYDEAVQKALRALEDLMSHGKRMTMKYKASASFLNYDAGLKRFSHRDEDVSSPTIERLRQMARDAQREVNERRALHFGGVDATDTPEIAADVQVDQAGGADEVADAA